MDTTKIDGAERPVNTLTTTLVSEPATGRYRPLEAVRAERLAAEAEAYFRLRRAVARRAEGGGAVEALRSTLGALAFSVRTRARSLAVPVRLDSGERHQKYLWDLVGRQAHLGDPLSFAEAEGGALAVVLGDDEFGDDMLGVLRPADAAFVARLRGFGAAPYVGRVHGDDTTWRLTLEVVVGHVGAAVQARRRALGRPTIGGDGLTGGDGEAVPTLPVVGPIE